MKRMIISVSAALLIILFVVPLMIFRSSPTPSQPQEPVEPTDDMVRVAGKSDSEQIVRVLDNGTVREMSMAEYLVGVVRAEVPAAFQQEALRAQAVAARTYTLYKIVSGSNHAPDADICTDSACCQAYLEEDVAREKYWGTDADHYAAKINDAVFSTDGQVILYNQQPILAAFHASSSALTMSAGQVWAYDVPYLQAVSSPEIGDSIPNYYSRAEFSLDDFQTRVLAAFPDATLSGDPSTWLSNVEADSAGNVIHIQVGGLTVKGDALRYALGLRSACFDWELQNNQLVFFVTGYGHGVGMSQYGANQMAKDGATWKEILSHYYTGVTIGPYVTIVPNTQKEPTA